MNSEEYISALAALPKELASLRVGSASFTTNGQLSRLSRGSVNLVFSFVKGKGHSPAPKGFQGWGRNLPSGPAAVATPTFALTHPSILRTYRQTASSGTWRGRSTSSSKPSVATSRAGIST